MTKLLKSTVEFEMTITKAMYDKATGEMRCRAVASDTEEDNYGDNMTLSLFNDFISRIQKNEMAPEPFRSDFWLGGMPYPSVSHYDDLNGRGVPGKIKSVYVDGNRLKSLIILDDTPLGRACFRAICEDLYPPSDVERSENPVRISIGFLDWQHRHKNGGFLFSRKSVSDPCPKCKEGNFGVEFLKGQLIHEAFTRVPVNPRTPIEVERSDMAITRKDDATSIVGEDLADELEEESQVVGKSEALVVKSEEDEEFPGEAEVVTDPQEVVDEAVVEPASERGDYEEDEEEDEDEKKKAKSKSEAETERAGPTTLKDYIATEQAREELIRMSDLYYKLSDVIYNIFQSEDIESEAKPQAIKSAIDEFREMLEAKALVKMSEAGETLPEEPQPSNDPLDQLFSGFRAAYAEITEKGGTDVEKLQALQVPFSQFGEGLRAVVQTPENVTIGSDEERLSNLEKSMTQVASGVAMLTELVAKGQTAEGVVPERRSIGVSPLSPVANGNSKPASIRDLARKSAGLG